MEIVVRVGATARAARALAGLALAGGALVGCGTATKTTSTVAGDPASGRDCPGTVVATLSKVLERVYREGVLSERTASARHMIAASTQLRAAVEANDAKATRAVAKALIASGHMTNLRIVRKGRTLASLGGAALTPLHGAIADASGKTVATYTTSVWSEEGFLAEGDGIAEGQVAVAANGRRVAGWRGMPSGKLPAEGSLDYRGVAYRYVSFPAETYPGGAAAVYLFKPESSTTELCGKTGQDTVFNTLSRVARAIYEGEAGHRTLTQVRRVQHDPALLSAVSARSPFATKTAIDALLNQHIVRLRVSAEGRLLSDVGGPYVLAPVSAKLRLGGRTIGSFVLSIQDDEGYLRLARRLAGLKVLMYMLDGRGRLALVKNSLGPSPGNVPVAGSYDYRGGHYRVYTLNGAAFPSGPLVVRVLIPIPYA